MKSRLEELKENFTKNKQGQHSLKDFIDILKKRYPENKDFNNIEENTKVILEKIYNEYDYRLFDNFIDATTNLTKDELIEFESKIVDEIHKNENTSLNNIIKIVSLVKSQTNSQTNVKNTGAKNKKSQPKGTQKIDTLPETKEPVEKIIESALYEVSGLFQNSNKKVEQINQSFSTRLIFPKQADDTLRYSEKELVQLFLEKLDKYNKLSTTNEQDKLLCSVETPSEKPYKNKGRDLWKDGDKERKSYVQIDVSIYNNNKNLINHIEFKHGTPNKNCAQIEKDFLRLMVEKQNNHNYFIHWNNGDESTLNAILERYNKSYTNAIKTYKNAKLEFNKIALVTIYLLLIETKSNKPFIYKVQLDKLVKSDNLFEGKKDFNKENFFENNAEKENFIENNAEKENYEINDLIKNHFEDFSNIMNSNNNDFVIFPKQGGDSENKKPPRYSEQEAKQLFIRKAIAYEFVKHYSVETPTRDKYSFSENNEDNKRIKTRPGVYEQKKEVPKGKRCGSIDLTLYNENKEKKFNIEFKYGIDFSTDEKCYEIEKDLLKLVKEDKPGYFIHWLLLDKKDIQKTYIENIKNKCLNQIYPENPDNRKYIIDYSTNFEKVNIILILIDKNNLKKSKILSANLDEIFKNNDIDKLWKEIPSEKNDT